MTPMRHILLRFEDGRWQEIADLSFVDGWMFAPEWLSSTREREAIDWGTFRYEVTKEEIRRLIRTPPDYSDIKAEWDRPFRVAYERQQALIDSLPDDGRYAVDWEEGV